MPSCSTVVTFYYTLVDFCSVVEVTSSTIGIFSPGCSALAFFCSDVELSSPICSPVVVICATLATSTACFTLHRHHLHSEYVFTCKTTDIADIVFLVDGSWSVGRFNFKTLKNFLKSLVRAFVVGSEHTRVGLVQYSGDPKSEWHLNTHRTNESVIDAVKNLPYKGGNTLTGLALTYILENSFKPESGSRPDVPKIGILITDGKSQDNVLSPAQRLRDAGIELFAIGIQNADENELRAIASPPEDTHMYNVANFSALSSIVKGVTRSVCERISEISKEISGKAVPDPQSDASSDLEISEIKGFCVIPTHPGKI
ncbi:collagen alpha-1(XIV) chain-like [Pseudorasbora parva]|uniref:collagen alpha-1(XIV) chain-like n=1 Tax=Pseudorasbora parva TaxID=51549 RepID=UPI00351DB6A3